MRGNFVPALGSRRLSTGLALLTLACAIVVAAFVGVALAAGNTVHVHPPADAKLNVAYSVSITGHTAGSERLYLFIDFHKCGATPAVEHQRANGDIWTLPGGKYKRTAKGWRSSLRGPDHACAYVQKLSQPVNSGAGILAHSFAGYTIH
jgi:hypothetical protein